MANYHVLARRKIQRLRAQQPAGMVAKIKFDGRTIQKNIKKNQKFGWTPKIQEQIKTDLSKRLFVAIAIKTFEKLEW
ncbi:hypothetical protein [Xanthovirga aplysinae]|uniref:hypothetical protein n=1 Tax=Xanthovirga aplysinae TaxID=2529853 RepID=UPI0012BCE1A7|nr:hypothetical protein [Xanthovirga aplysinae]MTI32526.1 hypothetical protein [Xanthovirga aplysinae]